MDIASLISIVLGLVMVIFGILSSNSFAFSAITDMYIDYPSLIITFGGSICSTLGCFKLADDINSLKSISLPFKDKAYDPSATIHTIIDLSNVGRKEGLLALEEAANGIEDEFLKKGIMLVVDGTDPELGRGILETDLMCVETRHKNVIKFWEKWAEMGPAWGMIGTLLGLIAMLNKLNDPSAIGPQMSVALITTLYGSLIANWLCAPIVGKLNTNNDLEVTNRQITIEGLLSIQAGENPRVIEEKLKSFLSPTVRAGMTDSTGGEE